MLRGLDAIGLSADALAASSGIDVALLTDPEHYVPGTAVHALWCAASAVDAGADLGLRVGAHVPAGAFDVLDYLLPSCASVGDALSLLERLHAVATTTSRLRVIVPPFGDVRIESELRVPPTHIHPQTRDYVFTMLVERLRHIHAQVSILALELRGPPNAALERYRAWLRAPVTFGHERSCIVISRETLALEIAGADATLRAILVRHATHLASKAPAEDLVDHARVELAVMLGEGRADIATLATRLGASTRSLQRRLAERGVPYSTLLDEARLALARTYLAAPSLSVDEVSALLGYSEPSAFARAFRRWTGMSPVRYRRGADAEPD